MNLHCNHARFVWNLAVTQAGLWRRGLRSPNSAERMRQLSQARAAYEWLGAGSSVVQQGALRDFDRAQRSWWSNPGHFSRPTFRRRGLSESFVVRDLAVRPINAKRAQVLVPKVGWVTFVRTRNLDQIDAATSARVTLDRRGRWHVSFTTEPPQTARVATGAAVGIDRGVANTIATSDGLMAHAPSLSVGEQARFLALVQRMSRQKKDSNRRSRTKASLARLHTRMGDRRRDWVEQTSTRLVRDYDLIALENLNTKGMVRKPAPRPDPDQPGTFLPNGARAKAGLNRAILAQSWGALQSRLTDKASRTPEDARTAVVLVNPRNTSRQCRPCGHIAAENRDSQAVFACVVCGHQAHADTNAAENILDRATNTTIPARGYAAGHAVNGRISPTHVGRVNHLVLA